MGGRNSAVAPGSSSRYSSPLNLVRVRDEYKPAAYFRHHLGKVEISSSGQIAYGTGVRFLAMRLWLFGIPLLCAACACPAAFGDGDPFSRQFGRGGIGGGIVGRSADIAGRGGGRRNDGPPRVRNTEELGGLLASATHGNGVCAELNVLEKKS